MDENNIIYPGGDILLQLPKHSPPFAIWDLPLNIMVVTQEVVTADTSGESETSGSGFSEDGAAEDDYVRGPSTCASGDSASRQFSERESEIQETTDQDDVVEMLVSSFHLIAASPYFRRMLLGNWRESVEYQRHGCTRVYADWDVNAMRILMKILHKDVWVNTSSISVETLARLAVLADYYECADAVRPFVEACIAQDPQMKVAALGSTLEYNRTSIMWLCISWIFRQPYQFGIVSQAVVYHAYEPIRTIELPIPPKVIRKSHQVVGKRAIVSTS